MKISKNITELNCDKEYTISKDVWCLRSGIINEITKRVQSDENKRGIAVVNNSTVLNNEQYDYKSWLKLKKVHINKKRISTFGVENTNEKCGVIFHHEACVSS